MDLHFTNLLVVCAIAFAAPLLLGLQPGLRLPAVVLELVAGIVVGPGGLGWVEVDEPVAVIALLGLAVLLFLAGLEVEFEELRGRTLRLALTGFAASFALALVVGVGLHAAGAVRSPVFVAIVLSATSLGVVIPVLKDSGLAQSPFGQLVIAAASIADVATVVLLSLLFSEESSGVGAKVLLLSGLAALTAFVFALVRVGAHSMRLQATVLRLQDTTAQIRIRGAVLLLVAFAVAAEHLGLEVILGTFVAGALLGVLDQDRAMTHPGFRVKLDAIGYGVFVPVFFVTSGLRFDLDALTSSTTALVLVPVFAAALLVVRGLPALLYRDVIADPRHLRAAALLQSTSLPFIVASTQIGLGLGLLSAGTAAGFVAAGLLSVLLFPLLAATLLDGDEADPAVGGLVAS